MARRGLPDTSTALARKTPDGAANIDGVPERDYRSEEGSTRRHDSTDSRMYGCTVAQLAEAVEGDGPGERVGGLPRSKLLRVDQTTTGKGRLISEIFAGDFEFERELIADRTRARVRRRRACTLRQTCETIFC